MTDPKTLSKLRDSWDRFARDDAMFYIATRKNGPWNQDAFFESGRPLCDFVLEWTSDIPDRSHLLEIGCGVGRLARWFAPYFDQINAVDISSEMIERARGFDPPENVRFHVIPGHDLTRFEDGRVDLILSCLMFQHLPDPDLIRQSLREVARLLAPQGQAVLHFDTRSNPLVRRLYQSLPDRVLPRPHRRFIRRYPLPVAELEGMMKASGLRLLDQRDPGTAMHFVRLGHA